MDSTLERQANVVLADLVANGGGTYEGKTLLPFTPTTGFAVGIGGIHLPADTVTAEAVVWAMKAVASEYETAFVGTWLDDGIVYFDAVHYVVALDRAMRLGQQAGQKAIYSFATKEALPL